MGKIKNENFIHIAGWMINELGLKGNELLVYAIIFGFSQTDDQEFTGSLQYLADWTTSTKQGVMNNLKSLVEKGYITKSERVINSVKFCSYRVVLSLPVLNKVEWGIKQSLMGGIKQSLMNNIDIDNKEDNIDNISNSEKRFRKPTIDEIRVYCQERKNQVDAEAFFNHYESVGWKVGKNPMKDWKAAVRTWERNSYGKPSKPRDTTLDDIF